MSYTESTQTEVYDHIISTDRFIQQFEQDLPRALRITSYRALLGLEEHVTSSGEYIVSIDKAFTEVLLNGTVNQTPYEVMQDSTLRVFEQRMQEIASRIGLNFSVHVQNVSLEHISPFELEVTSTIAVFVQTKDRETAWNYTTNLSSSLSIEQLRDPLYAVETDGRVPNVVYQSDIVRPYITATNDTTRLQELYNQTLYVSDTQAPSFLMRFTGNMSASPYGIASLVDTKILDAQGIIVQTDRSIVDYLYFTTSTSTNSIVNMPSEFILDDDHLSTYDAQQKTT
jgi:hypothetical protein